MRLEGSGAFHQQEGIGAALFYFSSLLESSGSSGSKVWSLWIPSLFRLGNSDAPPGFMDSLSSCRIPSFPLSSIIYVGYFDQVSRFLASFSVPLVFFCRILQIAVPPLASKFTSFTELNPSVAFSSTLGRIHYSVCEWRNSELLCNKFTFIFQQIAKLVLLDCRNLMVDAWFVLLFIIDEITSWGCAENSPNNISAMLNPCSWCFSFTNRCLD